MQEGLAQVKKTLRNIDDDLLVAENQARMWDVQAKTNLVDLLAPHRVIVREGRLKLVGLTSAPVVYITSATNSPGHVTR